MSKWTRLLDKISDLEHTSEYLAFRRADWLRMQHKATALHGWFWFEGQEILAKQAKIAKRLRLLHDRRERKLAWIQRGLRRAQDKTAKNP